MAYKAVVDFRDMQEDHDYKAGDTYPHKGSADPDRVKQLITPTAQRGALIAEVTEKTAEKVAEVPAEKKKSKKAEKKED